MNEPLVYDWVVIGSDTAALFTGVVASRFGLKVLVITGPLAHEWSGKDSNQQQLIDLDLNLVPGIVDGDRRAGSLAGLFLRMGISEEELRTALDFGAASGPIELISQDLRMPLEGGPKAWVEAMKMECPEVERGWPDLLNAIKRNDEEDLLLWRSDKGSASNSVPRGTGVLNKLLRSYSARRAGIAKREARHTLLGTPTPKATVPKNALEWFRSFRRSLPDDWGPSLLALRSSSKAYGGVVGFKEFLLRLCSRFGANVLVDQVCSEILIKNGRFKSVRIAGKPETYLADAGVIGCGLFEARTLCSAKGFSWGRQLKKPRLAKEFLFSVALYVRKNVRPQEPGSTWVFSEKGAPELWLEWIEESLYGPFSDDASILMLRTYLPYDPQSFLPDQRRIYAARMFRKACDLIPDLEFHLIKTIPDLRGPMTSVEPYSVQEMLPHGLKRFSGKPAGSHSAVSHLRIVGLESYPEDPWWGPWRAALESLEWLGLRHGFDPLMKSGRFRRSVSLQGDSV